MLGVATAGADCLGARHALVMSRYGDRPGSPLEETAASERYVAARSGVEAARLQLEREARGAGNARRDHAEARGVCRFLDDDSIRFRACEVSASAAYERTAEVRRHAAEAFRDAEAARNRARSALTDAELAASRARDALRDARRRVRRECGP